MTKKVLVAEDSLTVQKVIGFTLENEPFEIVGCQDEKSLFDELENKSFDLVALDMSLSEKKNGYDLVREIKLKYPKVSVLALFGTFDAIDEKAFKHSGADERIIKPFDSIEFVSKCKTLTKISQDIIEKENEEILTSESTSEDWTLDAPNFDASPKSEEAGSEFDSWGMDIPDIIETSTQASESLLEDGAMLLDSMKQASVFDQEDELTKELNLGEINIEIPEVIGKSLSDSYLSAEDLVPDEFSNEETVEISHPSLNLEKEINENITPEDFWAVDEGDSEAIADVVSQKVIEKVIPANKGNESLIMELKESLKPYIEEQIRKYCETTLEKVAWEVIPDLAENLIKKEIKEISKSLD